MARLQKLRVIPEDKYQSLLQNSIKKDVKNKPKVFLNSLCKKKSKHQKTNTQNSGTSRKIKTNQETKLNHQNNL